MKLYFTLFFSAAIVAILGGCNQQPAPATRHTPKYTVDIANKQYSEKAALQVVDAIKLQTTKKSLINQIAKIIKYGDYLFILTQVPQNNILIFKTDGTFLTKITKGRANNEVIYPTDISIDEMNDRLFVLDFYRTFKVFSLDGKYLSHTPPSPPPVQSRKCRQSGSMPLLLPQYDIEESIYRILRKRRVNRHLQMSLFSKGICQSCLFIEIPSGQHTCRPVLFGYRLFVQHANGSS